MAATLRSATARSNNGITVVVNGQVESGHFPTLPSLYIRATPWCSCPSGWELLVGSPSLSACCSVPSSGAFHVDLPLSATFRGITPFQWPQFLFACYGSDVLGHDVCRGYGALPVPTVPGSHLRSVACFVPEASSSLQRLVGLFTGRRPEFVEPAIVAGADGRDVTRVQTQGLLRVRLHVMIRGMKQAGYDVIPSSLSRLSDCPLPDFQLDAAVAVPGPFQPPQPAPLPAILRPPPPAQEERRPEEEESRISSPPQQEEQQQSPPPREPSPTQVFNLQPPPPGRQRSSLPNDAPTSEAEQEQEATSEPEEESSPKERAGRSRDQPSPPEQEAFFSDAPPPQARPRRLRPLPMPPQGD